MPSFTTLGLSSSLLKAIEKQGYTDPTPIQEAAIPLFLAKKDILGSAQTGTGKTAAFALPIIQALEGQLFNPKRAVKALILAPTRELAIQIQENFFQYGRFSNVRVACFYGGVSKVPQMKTLYHGVDIVVGTPGRVLDLIQSKALKLDQVQQVVLDEADQMLDMGFLPDVKTIISFVPKPHQTALFSATMPDAIRHLAQQILTNPERIAITPVEQPIDRINHDTVQIEKNQKLSYLLHRLKDDSISSALVFTRTKRGASRTALNLKAQGIATVELHGNQSQVKRNEAMKAFKDKKVRVLVATDIASRGIDINQLSHVVNFDMPETPEAFLHRIGRTARAGFSGAVIHMVSRDEYYLLQTINRHTGLALKPQRDTTFVFDGTRVIKSTDDDQENDRSGFNRHRRPKTSGYGSTPSSSSASSSGYGTGGSSYPPKRKYNPNGGSGSSSSLPSGYEGRKKRAFGDQQKKRPFKHFKSKPSN
jgi:ATP-dependent RNA helicase RhlE